jgi:hypothetical protein
MRDVWCASWMVPCLIAQLVLAQATIFSDDFESGALLTSAMPAGRWDAMYVEPGTSYAPSPGARHRGQLGVRLTDGVSGNGTTSSSWLRRELPNATGDRYVRFWFRTQNSNGSGFVKFMNIHGTTQSLTLSEAVVDGPGLAAELGAFGPMTTLPLIDSGISYQPGTWYLVEVSATGVGTTAGAARLWIDGVRRAEVTGLDWSTIITNWFFIGEGWCNLSWTGELDFDDVRVSTTPPASRLTWKTSGELRPGECTELAVRLEDSEGNVAPAPYDFTANLAGSNTAPAPLFSDALCTQRTSTAFFRTGQQSVSVWLRPESAPTVDLHASYEDFVPGQLSAPVQGTDVELLGAGRYLIGCGSAGGALTEPASLLLLAASFGWTRVTRSNRREARRARNASP